MSSRAPVKELALVSFGPGAVYEVESSSDPGVTYRVAVLMVSGRGHVCVCQCKAAAQFKRDCKHAKAARERLEQAFGAPPAATPPREENQP